MGRPTLAARLRTFYEARIVELERHQLDMIMRECHLAVACMVVASVCILMTLREVGGTALVNWFAVVSVIHVSEFLVIYLYKTGHLLPPDSPFFRVFVWIAGFFTGYFWSSFLFIVPWQDPGYFLQNTHSLMFFFSVVLVLAAGSTYYLPVYFSIMLGMMLPPVILLLVAPTLNGVLLLGFLFFSIYVHARLVIANNGNSAQLYMEQKKNLLLVGQLESEMDNSKNLHVLAQRSLLQKNQFIASASHDLRQPLHAFGLHLEALKTHVNSDEGVRIRRAMQSSVEALNVSFSELLDISKLDANNFKSNARDIELRSFLEERVESYSAEANRANILFRMEGPEIAVRVDALMLDRVVRNLVSNAVKYTNEGAITVSWSECQGLVLLAVKDTGVGIKREELDSIFDEYYRVDNDSMVSGCKPGLGLGLNIVSRLCQEAGWKLRVDSVVNSGSVFEVTLPVGEFTHISQGHAIVREVNLGKYSVLVIDDDPFVLQGMQKMLTTWGCSVIAADNVPDALRLASDSKDSLSLIIADYQLKHGESGLHAIELLREELKRCVPALIISGDTSKAGVEAITSQGYTLLSKPVLPEVLKSAIAEVLG